jgi:hypothetical protein
VQRDATASERDAVLDAAVDQLPDVPVVAPSNTEPVDSPFNPHPNRFP